MFQNKKLKLKTTSAIAKVAEVALCASNCALHIFAINVLDYTTNALEPSSNPKTEANQQEI